MPPPVDQFFTLHVTKKFIKLKDVELDFRMGCACVLVLFPFFMNNERTIYKFWIFEFWIFLFSNIAIMAYFDPQLPFLSLKFL